MTQPPNGDYRQTRSQTNPDEQGTLGRMVIGTEADREAVAEQERQLREGLKMGEDRALTQCGNWAAVEHQALYDQITNNNDPGQVYSVALAWTELGNEMAKSSEEMDRKIKETAHGWTGLGGDAAREATLKLAKWGGDAAQTSQYMGNRTNDLGLIAEDSKNRMPEPVKFDENQMMRDAFKSGGLVGLVKSAVQDIPAKRQEADNAHQNAIRVMQNNEASARHVDATTPVFSPPPPIGGLPGEPWPPKPTPPPPYPPPPYPPPHPPDPPRVIQPPVPPPVQPPKPPVVTPIPVPVRPLPPPVPPPPKAKPPVPPKPPLPPLPPPVPPPDKDKLPPRKLPERLPPQPPKPGDPTKIASRTPVPPPNLPTGGATGGKPPGGIAPGGILGALTGSSGGTPGSGTGAGRGSVAAGGMAGAQGPAAAGAGSAVAGAAGAAGRGGPAGAAGGPMGAGAGGRKEEDKEHKRADYLQETEDVWGDGKRVAPPVIGE
ncbi:PPE domain-containing protein [Crossiella sp. SN42]|uniref:PPE domain-containing protein n=1 Tax=Crossiella sp. SN42 TaxID=2944808 RepID=UPI00207D53E0|nr:PPE domain-containing protein [Crossiella sp. SN42]MCO1579698.1 PPE domain-containing protein [Crossiella sp. SN42]